MTVAPIVDVAVRMRPSEARWDAIVVGTGPGGAVAAALLAHAGKKVLAIDKNPVVGGALASYRRGGFKLDLGSHLISQGDHGALARAIARAGVKGPRFITHPIPVRSRGMFEISAPVERSGLVETALEAIETLHIPRREAAKLARLVFHILTLTEVELRRWDRFTLEELVLAHTEHPAAYFLFGFLASIFFVLPPWEVSAGESIRALRRVLLEYRLSYVEGGMDRLIHALLGRVVAEEGEVVVRARVTEIRRVGPRLLEVELEDGTTAAAPVVVFAGPPQSLPELARDLHAPSDYLERLQGLVGSGNAQQLKLALSRRVFDEGCMIGGFSPSGLGLGDLSLDLMRKTVDDIARGKISDPLVVYAPIPTNYDPSLAPPGCQLVAASIYGPSTVPAEDPPEKWRDEILSALDHAVPGLRDAVIFAEISPVREVAAWMGRERTCAAIANAQRPGSVGSDRLSVITPMRGLYLAGDGAGGRGVGSELAASSAMECVRAILRAERAG